VTARVRLSVGSLLLLAAATMAVAAMSGTARAAEATCPNTFHVLHNDHIGRLNLPEGHYTITLLDDQKHLGCQKAATLFATFLQDYDGNLPGKWRVKVAAKEFLRGHTGVGFRVTKGAHSGGGGGHHPGRNDRICPGTFQVEHDDHIGQLRFPAGKYTITTLRKQHPTCARAAKLFARFLQHPDGRLPDPWEMERQSATFTRGNTNFGFRVKRA
jgi:hypothetical protein